MGPRDLGALVLLSALWGASFIYIRVAVPALGPFVLVELRVAQRDRQLIGHLVRGRHRLLADRAGLGDWAKSLYVVANTPGTVYKDLLIQGTRVGEGPGPAAPGGRW